MVPADKAAVVAEVSQSLGRVHGGPWCVDFRNKVFRVDAGNGDQYEEVRKYGRSLDIPEYQLDFPSD